ncbi:MAG: hypothetical protein ACFFFG_13060 [Candidatus Thorarchaeota archaeon]
MTIGSEVRDRLFSLFYEIPTDFFHISLELNLQSPDDRILKDELMKAYAFRRPMLDKCIFLYDSIYM